MHFLQNKPLQHSVAGSQLLRVMKLTAILLLTACLQVSAKGNAQKVNLDMKNVSLEKVFKEIKKQSGFFFLYNNNELRKGFNPVTNIWCAHTKKARMVMANKEPNIAI